MTLLVAPDSTTLSYWLNWRVLLCAIGVFTPMVAAVFILWKHEGLDNLKSCRGKTKQEIDHLLNEDKAWRPCLDEIHPIWLLVYRAIAFSVLLISLIAKVSVNGFGMYYYYTQWTFTSVTVYFGFGVMLSICGCYRYHKMGKTESSVCDISDDAEQGYHVALINEDMRKFPNSQEEIYVSRAANVSIYLFQVLFQMNAGAVMLTDCIYWFIIFPFLTIKDYNLNFPKLIARVPSNNIHLGNLLYVLILCLGIAHLLDNGGIKVFLISVVASCCNASFLLQLMTVNMHTVNVIVLLGDGALNCLPFPWFRISYFILWTGVFVIFQWIVHARMSIWWPYPFMDLSSPYAPLWYLLVGLMHLPCYGLFGLIIKMKHSLFSKRFPLSYICVG